MVLITAVGRERVVCQRPKSKRLCSRRQQVYRSSAGLRERASQTESEAEAARRDLAIKQAREISPFAAFALDPLCSAGRVEEPRGEGTGRCGGTSSGHFAAPRQCSLPRCLRRLRVKCAAPGSPASIVLGVLSTCLCQGKPS